MATEFKIPNLGDGIKGGDVLNVLVKVGDTIAQDQNVLELETDKATIEVPSSVAGTVAEIKIKSGDKVTIGQVVLRDVRNRRPCGAQVFGRLAPDGAHRLPIDLAPPGEIRKRFGVRGGRGAASRAGRAGRDQVLRVRLHVLG